MGETIIDHARTAVACSTTRPLAGAVTRVRNGEDRRAATAGLTAWRQRPAPVRGRARDSGPSCRSTLGDTWTWDGTTWTQQHPATAPPARFWASMAYDAATGNVVLFGGRDASGRDIADTWTWDGTTWTQQHPATSPSSREGSSMAYDAATGTVVLFGGLKQNGNGAFNGTFTWDGTTWTRQAPVTKPPARWGAAMAYDAATGTVVLFGGVDPGAGFVDGGTWTWG